MLFYMVCGLISISDYDDVHLVKVASKIICWKRSSVINVAITFHSRPLPPSPFLSPSLTLSLSFSLPSLPSSLHNNNYTLTHIC